MDYRIEHDLLGEAPVPAEALHGIHTERALANFRLARRPVAPGLVEAYGAVKLACARANRETGAWAADTAKADAIELAASEMAEGLLTAHVVVDALQGGAGTSTNMNVNEVIANRALQLLGRPPGDYAIVSPLDDVNLHQSTNDTYPTALRVAAIRCLRELEREIVALQESLQAKEKQFARVVKVGRTQLQDAVLVTLGREFGAFAEAVARDRWRVYKCEERLRVVNLGGTAIGTGICAPRRYIFRVVDILREVTGLGLARAENLVEATQNADVFAEVSGILKAHAVNLHKIANDLRLLSSGPSGGLDEIELPARQAGSSIMPGKVNPVIPETVVQAAMMVMAHDQAIAMACAAGNLELNAFLPLVAHCLLESITMLREACRALRELCVDGITANEARCRAHTHSSTATITALLPLIGYEGATRVIGRMQAENIDIREAIRREGILSEAEIEILLSPEGVMRLGDPERE